MKMQLFLLILYSVVKVLSDDVEISLDLDTNELQNVGGPVNAEDHDENVQMVPDAIDNSKQTKEVDATNEQLDNENENDKTNDKLEKEDVENDTIEKFNIGKPEPLSLKNDRGLKMEPGFDLTPEEISKFKIWKNGDIPYYIDVVSFSDKVLRDSIRSFLRMVNDVTGLNFEEMPSPPSNDNERWVFFINRRGLLGCADHTVKNFTNRGVQQVVLGYDCMATKGELAEAVMSIVGVPAQHNAPNRDKYIKLNMENVMPDKRHLFEKLKDNEWLFHDLEYDLQSVTHYDIHKYSANGRATIQPMKGTQDIVPAISLSPTDFLKIKMLYNYMSRNKELQIPECEKLFKPRSKYVRFIPNDKSNIKPRKKPNKYLGTADNDRNEDESKDQAESNNDEEPRGRNEGYDNQGTSQENKNGEATKVSLNQEMVKLNYQVPIGKTTTLDPLLVLSDYESEFGD